MNRQFGALSGLAIIFVVLNHSIHMGTLVPQQMGLPPVIGPGAVLLVALQQLGTYAVPVFLFISGCFAVYSAQNASLWQSYKSIWARLQHILWPYLIWSVVFYIVVYIQWGEEYTLPGYIKNLLVGYPFNFVPLLLLFYLLAPLLVRIGRNHGLLLVAALGLYQVVLINLVIPGALGFQFPAWMNFLVPRVVSTTLADWAVFFPLGIVYSLHARSLVPALRKLAWLLLIALIALFVLRNISVNSSALSMPLVERLAPLPLIGLVPLIKRNQIPMIEQLEWVGRMSYGLYLTHLVVADVVIWLFEIILPWLLTNQLILEPFLFVLALGIPLGAMYGLTRLPVRSAYHYVFG